MRITKPKHYRRLTASEILEIIRDQHRQQCQFDPEADREAVIRPEMTVAAWRAACDLVGWRKLGRARWILASGLVNAAAVAAVAERLGERIAIIPAGERWPNGTLRPAYEDQLGAGAIIHYLRSRKSPEALAAEMVFRSSQKDLCKLLRESISGREIVERGSSEDVEIACQLNAYARVPVLVEGGYRAWPPTVMGSGDGH